MTGAKALAIVAVKVFVKQDQVSPVRIVGETPIAAVAGSGALSVGQEKTG